MPEPRVYLDHAASAPLSEGVAEAMAEVLAIPGNPSSPHAEGRLIKERLEQARSKAAEILGCRPRELVFTASGTLAAQIGCLGAARTNDSPSKHVVASAVEHPSIADGLHALEHGGFVVTRVDPDPDGHVNADSFVDAVRDDTSLAALMLANHETGACMPVREVANALRARRVPLLSDACLGPGRIPTRPNDVGADLIAYSGHKFGGPRGSGLLFVRRRTRVSPVFQGGLQEEKLHAGTENVAAAVGLVTALERAIQGVEDHAARYAALGARLLAQIEEARPWTHLTPPDGLPGFATIEFPGVEGEAAMINMDLEGFAVSTGSRCALGATDASPSLLAMGLSSRRAASTLRVSVGEGNDEDQIDRAAQVLVAVIARLRSLAHR